MHENEINDPMNDYQKFMSVVDEVSARGPRCQVCGGRRDIERHRFPWDKDSAIALCGVCSDYANRLHDRHELWNQELRGKKKERYDGREWQ